MMTEELKRKAIYIIHDSKGKDRQELNYKLFNAGICIDDISELTGESAIDIFSDIRKMVLGEWFLDFQYVNEVMLIQINEFFKRNPIPNDIERRICIYCLMGFTADVIALKTHIDYDVVKAVINKYSNNKSQKKEEEQNMSMKIDEIKEARARLVEYISDNLGDEIKSTYEDFDNGFCTEREYLSVVKKLSDKYNALFKDLDDLTNELKETKAKLESIKEFTNKEV